MDELLFQFLFTLLNKRQAVGKKVKWCLLTDFEPTSSLRSLLRSFSLLNVDQGLLEFFKALHIGAKLFALFRREKSDWGMKRYSLLPNVATSWFIWNFFTNNVSHCLPSSANLTVSLFLCSSGCNAGGE